MAIVVRCGCGKSVLDPAQNFEGFISPMAEIEDLRWRCSWCGRRASYVRWRLVQDVNREALAQWKPPPGMRRRH
ncbi:hypothetical protein GCM10011390_03280 [Aureimonas endophytica]|uniref:Uncharacterized protein n=1 Tax=Aureimonas endophytica TaxID=2027858 RepID=A0A916ZC57_9HYPH|nr:hypothetical protein [Aureimonas endophytica]GGD87860.1 hypothetical protein GCM10011390_03280 [Aureimonas endophytica]